MPADTMNSTIVLLTLRIAAFSTLIIFPIALAVAAVVSRLPRNARVAVETICSLPLVLPPTAVGVLLLELLSRHHWFGGALARTGVEILFTPAAVVLAAAVMSFPLMFRSFRVAVEAAELRLVDVARTLGATPLRAFFRVVVPLSWPGLVSGIVLAYCRAIGEFGATIVVGGNIPGRTQTLAVGIYQHIQTGRDDAAFSLLLFSIVLGAFAIATSEVLMRRQLRHR